MWYHSIVSAERGGTIAQSLLSLASGDACDPMYADGNYMSSQIDE